MGRTVITATQLIQQVQAEHWGKFRRALRREDQEILDRLFDRAQYHAQAMAYAAMPVPMEPILVAMLIEIQRDLLKLQKQLREPPPEREDECDSVPALYQGEEKGGG
jgi:hypothetical protein